jgi:hypothetical protein
LTNSLCSIGARVVSKFSAIGLPVLLPLPASISMALLAARPDPPERPARSRAIGNAPGSEARGKLSALPSCSLSTPIDTTVCPWCAHRPNAVAPPGRYQAGGSRSAPAVPTQDRSGTYSSSANSPGATWPDCRGESPWASRVEVRVTEVGEPIRHQDERGYVVVSEIEISLSTGFVTDRRRRRGPADRRWRGCG